jgi:hypothetical protein
MRDIALCVVAARHCSTSRTYLTYLKAAGLRPRRVLLVDFVWNNERFRRLSRWIGRRFAHAAIRKDLVPWPPLSPEFVAACGHVQDDVPLPIDYLSEFDFAAHAQSVERFVATDFDDPGMHAALRRQPVSTFLYTDGGRVPGAVLGDPALKVLHVHPGVVPDVKGSDGLFWSLLARGKPGVSCFYMDEGIDTGRLIRTREFARPRFPRLAEIARSQPEIAYRAVLYAYDPHLRAQLFCDVMAEAGDDLSRLPAVPQTEEGPAPYLAMHPALRARLLAEVCR